jgi:hypothetical protein
MDKITAGAAGITFATKENPDLLKMMVPEGAAIQLVPEPENTYDPKAIKLEYEGIRIGYVPRKKDGVDFIIQAWCHANIDTIKAWVETVWYNKNGQITFEHSEGCELAGIDVSFKIPKSSNAPNDIIITKHSFSEPDIVVDFNDTQHIYNMRCADGEYRVLKGGTTYIKRFFKPFDAVQVSRQCAKYWGVTDKEIQDLWNSNGQAAGLFGSAVHYALEHYINHRITGETITNARLASGKEITENYAMPKHPFLNNVIKSLNKLTDKLDKKHKAEEIVAEALITDSATGWCGLVDRLCIIDSKKKIARVQDYKVNINAAGIEPHNKPLPPFDHMPANKLTKYALQMSFYASLLKKHGWTIKGLDVFIYEDEWRHYELEMVEFDSIELEEKKKPALKVDNDWF